MGSEFIYTLEVWQEHDEEPASAVSFPCLEDALEGATKSLETCVRSSKFCGTTSHLLTNTKHPGNNNLLK